MALFALPAGLAADRLEPKAAHDRRRTPCGRSPSARSARSSLLDEAVYWVVPVGRVRRRRRRCSLLGRPVGSVSRRRPDARSSPRQSAVVDRPRSGRQRREPRPRRRALRRSPAPSRSSSMRCSTRSRQLHCSRCARRSRRNATPTAPPCATRLVEGFRFLWEHAFLRTSALLFGLANFVGPGVMLAIVVIGEEQGLTSGEVGAARSRRSACSCCSEPSSRRSSGAGSPSVACCCSSCGRGPGAALFLVWPNVYVLTASILPTALAIPSTDSVVHSYRYAMTPDRLQGRVGSVWTTIGLAIAPLGPLVAGLLLESGLGARDDRGVRRSSGSRWRYGAR